MEEEEALGAAVLTIERVDGVARGVGQRVVRRQRFLVRVLEVGEQRVMQVVVAVGEEAHLQPLDQPVELRRARQHRRHHDQGARRRRDAAREVHLRQRFGRRQRAGQAVDERHGELAGG
jgi:hypothetical protein